MSSAPRGKKSRNHSTASPSEPGFSLQTLITRPVAVLLLLSLLALAAYFNTFFASFHFDDTPNITANSFIKYLSNLRDISGSRYVGFLTFALNYHFGRLNVFGYHLVNLLIHILNGFLVYLLVRLLFRAAHTPPLTPDALRLPAGQAGLTPAPWIALATALLFTVHPIQTQAVTYIVQRFASLAALFYILTVVCYLEWRLSPLKTKRRHLWYAGAMIATILAMKTKEITFTLPIMLLLVEVVFFTPFTRKSWFRLLPFFLTLPVIPLSHPGALGEGEAGFARQTMAIGRWDYLFTQFRVIVTYLRLLVFPANQNLDYEYPIYHSLFDPPVFLSFLFLSALFGLAIYLLLSSRLTPHASRQLPSSASRLMGFGMLWFFLTLSIESSIIPIRDVIFEHRVYLPSVGFFLTAAVAVLGLSNRWRIPKRVAVALLILVLAGVTYQRNKVWQNEFTLWSDVVSKSPNKYKGYNNLGLAYAEQKRWKKAIQLYQTSIGIKPNRAKSHNNLGQAYHALGRRDEAFREFQIAVNLDPKLVEAHSNLGNLYQELGRRDEAVREYQTAITLDPDFPGAHVNLGNVYQELGRWDEAIREFQTALTLKPDYAEPHYNLGNVYQDLGRLDEAIREYQTATTLKPDYAMAYYNLGIVFYTRGQFSDALSTFQKTTQLEPNFAQAHNNLGFVYSKLGRTKEAIQEYEIAVKLNPDLANAYYNLGQAYQRMGRSQEALRAYERALKIKPDDEKTRQAIKSLPR